MRDGAAFGAPLVVAVGRRDELCESEVEDLDEAIAPDHDVLGLDVAVNDAVAVRRTECRCDGNAYADGLPCRDDAGRHPSTQRLAVHVLHREEWPSGLDFAEGEDGADVRVAQGGGRARLPREPRMTRRVAGDVWWQELERDHPLQLQIAREPHFAHPADSQDGHELVVIDAIAGATGHAFEVYKTDVESSLKSNSRQVRP